MAHNFFATAAHNVEKSGPDEGIFERIVFAENGVSETTVALFNEYVKTRGQEFLEELDNWLVARQKLEKETPRPVQTGFGMYHYVENSEDKVDLRELLIERGLEVQGNGK